MQSERPASRYNEEDPGISQLNDYSEIKGPHYIEYID